MIVAIIFATAALLVAVVTAINARHQQTLIGFLNRRVLALEQELAKPGGPLHGQLLGPNTLPPFGTGASAFARYPQREPPPAKSAP